ncbi:MAG: cadmium-translocating P-type ATPase [Proteobacteria bacterium]|nr:cadmium-translocating P-type ATPase [Pseudomonadota bacterium]MBS0574751.1 cadmium-translocating P-type ATPase [Pseudomonadota bacterium]
MSLADGPLPSACPACVALPATEALAESRRRAAAAGLVLSVPGLKDAAGMALAERTLAALPGVTAARVNLTLKRIGVTASPDITPQHLTEALSRVGILALELDPALLSTRESERRGRDLLMRLGVAGFSMMNIMLLSVAVWSGAEAATRDLFHWISAMIALPTLAFAGQPFFASALASLRARRLGMDVPISLALILSSAISLYETIRGGEHAYFDAAVSLCFFLLIGRYLDFRSRAAARSAAEELAALEVPRAVRLADGREQLVPIADILPGDLVLVRPGARMPVDGVVAEGASELDRSLLTGETLPVAVAAGAATSAGEMNLTGPLTVRVTAAGRESSLHRMADLVAIAESARNRYMSLADRMARRYSPAVHLLALASFVGWMIHSGGDVRLAVNVAAAVLIITCPCALALAVPSVVTAASGRLFRKGLLIKDGTALERLAEVDTVVFDKTGTLTLGAPVAAELDAHRPGDLEIAAALAAASSHPLARALAEAIAARGLLPAPVSDLRERPGYGVEGLWQGRRVRLGRAAWLGAEAGAETATWLAVDGQAPVEFRFIDRIRPGARDAVAALTAAGLRVRLMSGDARAPVAALAADLGIADWQAEMLPADKAAAITAETAGGHRVLMVGDGLNDTVALAAAHVSISPASALDAARVASDIVLLGQDLAPIADARRIAVTARRRIKQNFALSLGYNAVAVPVALIGLATPLIAALAMSTSSLTVTLNALRLK